MENINSSSIKFIMSNKAQLILNRATAKVTRSDHHTFKKKNYYKTTK